MVPMPAQLTRGQATSFVIVVLSLFLASVSVCLGGANLGPRLWPKHLP